MTELLARTVPTVPPGLVVPAVVFSPRVFWVVVFLPVSCVVVGVRSIEPAVPGISCNSILVVLVVMRLLWVVFWSAPVAVAREGFRGATGTVATPAPFSSLVSCFRVTAFPVLVSVRLWDFFSADTGFLLQDSVEEITVSCICQEYRVAPQAFSSELAVFNTLYFVSPLSHSRSRRSLPTLLSCRSRVGL